MEKKFIGLIYGKKMFVEIESDEPDYHIIKWSQEIASQSEEIQYLLNRNWLERLLNTRYKRTV